MPNCKKGDLAYVYRNCPPEIAGKIFLLEESTTYNGELFWLVPQFTADKRLWDGIADRILKPLEGLDPNDPAEKEFLDELKKAGSEDPVTTTREKETIS